MLRSHGEGSTLEYPAKSGDLSVEFGGDIEKIIGASFLDLRTARKISRSDLASIIGIKETSLRRHEFGKTKITVSRLIQICETLDANPIEVLGPVAPHLFGATADTADQVIAIMKILVRLDAEAATSVLGVVQHLARNN